jgi:hypothetical protein
MDRGYASLERIKALWQQLERAKADSPEYKKIAKQIRAESDAYAALIDAEKSPRRRKREDSN